MFVLPKGTLVKFHGLPFRLLEDVQTDGTEVNYKLALAELAGPQVGSPCTAVADKALQMTIEKHPAEVALALLRDYPEICEAEGVPPVRFRQYARPIIDAYFAPLGEKLCRPPCPPPTQEQIDAWEAARRAHETAGTGAYASPSVPRAEAGDGLFSKLPA